MADDAEIPLSDEELRRAIVDVAEGDGVWMKEWQDGYTSREREMEDIERQLLILKTAQEALEAQGEGFLAGIGTWLWGSEASDGQKRPRSAADVEMDRLIQRKSLLDNEMDDIKERMLAREAGKKEAADIVFGFFRSEDADVRLRVRMGVLQAVSDIDPLTADAVEALGRLYSYAHTVTVLEGRKYDWSIVETWDRIPFGEEVIRITEGGVNGYAEVDIQSQRAAAGDHKSLGIMQELLCVPPEFMAHSLRVHIRRSLINAQALRKRQRMQENPSIAPVEKRDLLRPPVIIAILHVLKGAVTAVRLVQKEIDESFDKPLRRRNCLVAMGQLAHHGNGLAFEALQETFEEDQEWSMREMSARQLCQCVEQFGKRALGTLFRRLFDRHEHWVVREAVEKGLSAALSAAPNYEQRAIEVGELLEEEFRFQPECWTIWQRLQESLDKTPIPAGSAGKRLGAYNDKGGPKPMSLREYRRPKKKPEEVGG